MDTLRGYVRRADLFQEHAGGVPCTRLYRTYGPPDCSLPGPPRPIQNCSESPFRTFTRRGAGEGSSDSPALRRRSVRPVQLASRDSVGVRVGCDWQR